jgi:hypothetical protein
VVGDDFGQSQLRGKLVVALLHLFQTVNHEFLIGHSLRAAGFL